MTLTPSRALASSGVDRFSPSQLLRTARLLASDPQLSSLVDHHRAERRWVELDSSPYLQIWLLSWPAGTETGWHDHGESAGAFLTVSGSLTEQTSPDHRRHDRTLTVGEGRPFGRGHIHKVANDSLEAASPCTSTPRLASMTRYAVTPAGLKVRAVDRARVTW